MKNEQEEEMKSSIALHEIEAKIWQLIKEYESKYKIIIDMIDIYRNPNGGIKIIKAFPKREDGENWSKYMNKANDK